MLNEGKIESILKRSFNTFHPIERGLARCERVYGSTPVSIYFFDYKDDISRAAANLRLYQDSVLADHYYKHSGPIQWNYYLIFVLGDATFKRLQFSSDRDAIEKDRLYARKSVVGENELEEFLSKPTDSAYLEPISDISIGWIEKLNSVGLGGVCTDEPRIRVINNYLAGTPITQNDEDGSQDTVSSAPEKITIAELLLKKYRPFPTKRDYQFGKVNLLSGPNGAGKTSLLEAIELAVCGATYRNDNHAEPNAVINIRFNGETEFETYEPRNNRKYQYRDLRWYGNSVLRGNDLPTSFNRYNFYNADSAFRLAHDTKATDIDAAFAALALGERANVLDRRLREFEGDFDNRYKDAMQQVALFEEELEQTRKSLAELAAIKTPSHALLEAALTEARKVPWLEPIPDTDTTFPEGFDAKVRLCHSKGKAAVDAISWPISLTLVSLTTERGRLEVLTKKLLENRSQFELIRKQTSETDTKRSSLKRRMGILLRSKPYFENQRSAELRGLSEKLSKLSLARDRLKRVSDLAATLKPEELGALDSNLTLSQIESGVVAKIATLSGQIQQYEREFQAAQSLLGRTQAILGQIKKLGSEYSSLLPEASACPLCETKYSSTELRERIGRSPTGQSLDLKALNQALLKCKSDLEGANRSRDISSLLRSIAKTLSLEEGPNEPTIGALLGQLTNARSEFWKSDADYSALRATQEELRLSGLTEEELHELTVELSAEYPDLAITADKRKNFEDLFNSARVDYDALELKARGQQENLEKLENERAQVLQEYLGRPTQEIEAAETEANRRKSSLAYAFSAISEISQRLLLQESDDISSLVLLLNSVLSRHDEYRQALQREKLAKSETDTKTKRAAELEKKLVDGRLVAERAKTALDTIRKILETDNKDQALSKFIERNRETINYVFRKIHSPAEFDGLVPQTTKLRRKGAPDPVSLNKVSTGQRAALAVSVFLAMNVSIQRGPSIILIDDPVAHVDDLNTLSFLDYLRDLVLHRERQVFFATASQKLASLFEKKFQFLGDEFKKFELSR